MAPARSSAAALRDAPDAAPIPILVLSPEPEAREVKALREAGASDIMDRHDVERVRQFLAMVLTPLPVLSGRVMLVDDDPEESSLVLDALRNLGLEVHQVASAAHGLDASAGPASGRADHRPAAAAPISGAGLIRELRALPGSEGRTPVLAIIRGHRSRAPDRGLRSGADDFIPRPVVAGGADGCGWRDWCAASGASRRARRSAPASKRSP